jgi:hypothetical protein
MTTDAGWASGIGVVSAIGAAVLQKDASTGPSMAMMVPVVSAVIGGVMSYAVLRTTVSKMERDMRDMRKDMSDIYTLVRESLTKVAKLEGRLDSHP